MMKFIKIFQEKIKKKKTRSIKEIIRCKNGWTIYNSNYPQYTDIKLNVLIQAPNTNDSIISEIQLLLDLMSSFKKKAHKLYSIERKFELVYNFGKLQYQMKSFKDNKNGNDVIIDLANNDDIKYFKLLWTAIQPNSDTLLVFENGKLAGNVWDHSLFHIIYKDGEINNYLKSQYADLFYKTIFKFIKIYGEQYRFDEGRDEVCLLQSISSNNNEMMSKDDLMVKFIKHVLESVQNDTNKLIKILKIKDQHNNRLIGALCKTGNTFTKSINLLLDTKIISDKYRIKLFENGQFYYAFQNRYFDITMEILEHFKNDRKILLHLLQNEHGKRVLFTICGSKDRSSNTALYSLFNHPLITDSDLYRMFSYKDDSWGLMPFTNAISYGFYINVRFILNKYGNDKKQIIKWLFSSDCPLTSADDACTLEILRYFKNDRSILLKLISQKRVIHKICESERIKSLKFILYECDCIKYKDIVDLLCDKECFTSWTSPIFDRTKGFLNTGLEILKYIKNDRLVFIRLLSCIITDGRNIIMLIFNCYQGSYISYHKSDDTAIYVLRMIFEDSPLNIMDKYNLLSYRNEKNESVLSEVLRTRNANLRYIFLNLLMNKNFDQKLFIKLV
eukprot:17403_1